MTQKYGRAKKQLLCGHVVVFEDPVPIKCYVGK